MKQPDRQLDEENKKLRRLQWMVELTRQLLYQTPDLTVVDGLRYIDTVRRYAVFLFPGKGQTFDLIYRPRLMRVLWERGILDFSHN